MNKDAAAPLTALAEDYWQFICFESPMLAILAGEPTGDAVLFRESPADHDRRAAGAAMLLGRLREIALEGLDIGDRTTHRLMQRELEYCIESHRLGAHLRPSLFPAGPEFNLVFLANGTSLVTVADAERYLERLATVPQLFADLQECLQAGIARGFRYSAHVVKCAAEAARANLRDDPRESQLYGPFTRGAAVSNTEISALAESAAGLIGDGIMPAIESYVRFIAEHLGSASRESLACTDDVEGEAWYALLTRYFTSLDASPDEIHQLGLDEVDRLTACLEEVAAEAGYVGRLADYREWVNESDAFVPPSLEQHLEQVRALCKRIDSRIPAFFGNLPRITYGVEIIPQALASTLPPAYAQPGPADNSSPGIFWVTCQLDKCPTYMYPSLALHEAWPGHLMQIALMQEQSQLPAFRRNGAVKYTACVEGWAMYCEQLGEDMGVYTTPHECFGRLNMEMWRAVRLVVDTGIHTRGWTREQAIAYMTENVSITPAMIAAEVDRYIALPGQALAYQLGNLKFRELRQRAQQRLGGRFDLRGFHDALIAAGPVTLPILDECCEDWIQQLTEEDAVA